MSRILLIRTVQYVLFFTLVYPIYAEGERESELSFYVSTNGDDAWSGLVPVPNQQGTDGPFASLGRARDEIRLLKKNRALPKGLITVYLLGGIYPLARGFRLTIEDSGTPTSPITYRAYKDMEVRLIGGVELPASLFEAVCDTLILRKLSPEGRDNVLQADLKAYGITDYGEFKPRGKGRGPYPAALELFFDDQPMQLARWPNRGWVKIGAMMTDKHSGRFTYEGSRPKGWAGVIDIWLHGYWTWDWADSYVKVKSIDTLANEITTYQPHGVYGYSTGKRFYALNILKELDKPGEWYVDRNSGILYFWSPAPIHVGKIFVSILEEPMVSLQNVSHVTLQNLILENARGAAIEIVGSTNTLIAGCSIRNIGTNAIIIDGGKMNGVVACDIYNTGGSGILLRGGARKSLIPAGNYILNNNIHHISRWVRTYRPAVGLAGVGHYVANNFIHDVPHTAILLSGNDHIIEFNEICNIGFETGDVGAFYMGRDWTERGNIIRYNYFHDIQSPFLYGAKAIYLDDLASGTIIYSNVFYRVDQAVYIGGGRDNLVENNIFIECNSAVRIDARGMGGVTYTMIDSGIIRQRLEAIDYKNPPWSTRYPELIDILNEDPGNPKGNVIVRNVNFNCGLLKLKDNGFTVTVQDNYRATVQDFFDSVGYDFQIKDESPAYKRGFKRIPMEQIGLYRDEYRVELHAVNVLSR